MNHHHAIHQANGHSNCSIRDEHHYKAIKMIFKTEWKRKKKKEQDIKKNSYQNRQVKQEINTWGKTGAETISFGIEGEVKQMRRKKERRNEWKAKDKILFVDWIITWSTSYMSRHYHCKVNIAFNVRSIRGFKSRVLRNAKGFALDACIYKKRYMYFWGILSDRLWCEDRHVGCSLYMFVCNHHEMRFPQTNVKGKKTMKQVESWNDGADVFHHQTKKMTPSPT